MKMVVLCMLYCLTGALRRAGVLGRNIQVDKRSGTASNLQEKDDLILVGLTRCSKEALAMLKLACVCGPIKWLLWCYGIQWLKLSLLVYLSINHI